MSTQKQSLNDQPDKQKSGQLETQPAVAPEQGEALLSPEATSASPLAAANNPNLQAQINTLADSRLLTAQREMLAEDIATTQGNQHMLQVMQGLSASPIAGRTSGGRIQRQEGGTRDGTVVVNQSTEYYDITGTTGGQLAGQLNRANGWAAFTDWDIRYTQPSSNYYQVTLSITITLPRWTNQSGASAELIQSWNTYLANLTKHEQGHAALQRDTANNYLNALLRGAGEDLEDILQAGRQADRDYDTNTQHGVTQGANSNILTESDHPSPGAGSATPEGDVNETPVGQAPGSWPQIVRESYTIQGDTGEELIREMSRRGPHGYYAYTEVVPSDPFGEGTSYKFPYVYEDTTPEQEDGKCQLTGVRTSVKIVTTLPQWTNQTEAPEALQANWRTYLDNLTRYMERHEQINTDVSTRMFQRLSNELFTFERRTRQTETNAVRDEAIEQSETRTAELDQQTQNGLTEGVDEDLLRGK